MKKLNISRINLEIENQERAIALTDKILEVFKECDGKQMTKRIDTKLKALDKNLSLSKTHFGNWELSYGFWDSRYDSESKEYTFNDQHYYFCYYKKDVVQYSEIEGKMKQDLESTRESTAKLKQQMKDIDRILVKRAELVKELNQIHHDIHWVVKTDLNLDFHLFWDVD